MHPKDKIAKRKYVECKKLVTAARFAEAIQAFDCDFYFPLIEIEIERRQFLKLCNTVRLV